MKNGFRIQQIKILKDHADIFLMACRRWPLQACSGSPFNSTSPSPGVSRRLISRNKVLFPAPL